MSKPPPDRSASLACLLASYGRERPAAIPTLRTILKNVALPHHGWGWGRGDKRSLDEVFEAVPAEKLYGLLDAAGTSWAPAVLKRLPAGHTHHRAYCRALRRLVAHGEAAGLCHPDHYFISPDWRGLAADLEALVAAERPHRKSLLRRGFRQLAQWATAESIEPAALPVAPADGTPLASFKASLAEGSERTFYLARCAWNLLAAADPEKGLSRWGNHVPQGTRPMSKADWPVAATDGLELLFLREGLGAWCDETRKGYRQRVAAYLGALSARGIDVAALLAGCTTSSDAVRLLFQGIPADYPRREAHALAEHLGRQPEARTDLIATLTAQAGVYDGRAAEPNPFIVTAVAVMTGEGRDASARDLLVKALAINRGLLGMTDRHVAWLTTWRRQVDQLIRRRPKAYTLKKRALFRSPTLWADLVRARPRLRAATQALEAAWRGRQGPDVRELRRRWAVALRDEVMFGLLICYPLRVRNLLGMQLDVNYLPKRHAIRFEAEDTKNFRSLDFELPETGALADLRQLVDQYLAEARPTLLVGRASRFFFVPDYRGGDHLHAKAANDILTRISRRFLSAVLPEGVQAVNPHLMRHAAASYHLAVGQNLNLAAQLLGDAPSTVTRAYADVLADAKGSTKRFLSGFEV